MLLPGCVTPTHAPWTHLAAHDDSRGSSAPGATEADAIVVVATLDTGVNPFHPAFRRSTTDAPASYLPGYPLTATRLDLQLGHQYANDVQASIDQLNKLRTAPGPAWVPGTNLIALWAHPLDAAPVFDVAGAVGNDPEPFHAHGARAASQIAGTSYSFAPNVLLAIMDTSAQGGRGPDPYALNAEALRWAADQMWIDIIHTNIQNFFPLAREETAVPGQTPPYMRGYPDAVEYAVARGKLVVVPAGNFYAEPTETSPHAGIPGVLVVGANDNCGFSDFSNLNPHVVMDGHGTRAAAANGYGQDTFGGTSSSSPRVAGYAARLLQDVRTAFGELALAGTGSLVALEPGAEPKQGPLADGRLTAAELHQVIRQTADPSSHDSRFDGTRSRNCIPEPVEAEVAFYPKMGYGEVSEHTYGAALDVLLGRSPMPSRPAEDAFFGFSDALRSALWEP